jgi:small-conductance mechanosensitive channel
MKDLERQSPERRVKASADTGLFAMMAMMMVCCVGIFVIVALIPLIGWPAGIVVATLGGAALTFAFQRVMNHGPKQ